MRTIIYVPLIHELAEAGLLREILGGFQKTSEEIISQHISKYSDSPHRARLKKEATEELGRVFKDYKEGLQRGESKILASYWGAVGEIVESLGVDYSSLVVFEEGWTEGTPIKGIKKSIEKVQKARKERENLLSKTNHRFDYYLTHNQTFMYNLMAKGAQFKETESQRLHRDHGKALKTGKGEKKAMKDRDRYIAGRINKELREGFGLLLLGGDHNPFAYLDRDISIISIDYSQVASEVDGFLDRFTENMLQKPVSRLIRKLSGS